MSTEADSNLFWHEGSPAQPGAQPEGPEAVGGAAAGLSTEVLRIAFHEAMQARLDAFLAGERVYDELVRAAEARSGQILAEAQAEADRILDNARTEAEQTLVEAVRQTKSLQDEAVRQAWETNLALADLRSQRSTRIHALWTRLTGRSEEAEPPPAEPGSVLVGHPGFARPVRSGEIAISPVATSIPSAGSADLAPDAAPDSDRVEQAADSPCERQLPAGDPEVGLAPSRPSSEMLSGETKTTDNRYSTEAGASGKGSWTVPDWLK